jgi:NAD(P)-dependent dehydrogenase (short-subunit alcohol dehydrogenase family)
MQFLVTGCSSGLGLSLVRSILRSGHRVIATSRNPSKTPNLVAEVEKSGGVWTALDLSWPDLESAFSSIISKHGPIDVIINNAGYASGGVLEDVTLADSRALMETNFWGPFRTMQAIIPSMRQHGNGVIVNMCSAEFWEPHPLAGIYGASKFALEGLTESVAMEVAAFGIRVLCVEPGATRTEFVGNIDVAPLPEAYKGTIAEFVQQAFQNMHGTQPQDPDRTADAVIQEVLQPKVDSDGRTLLRMPLGQESLQKMKARAEEWLRTVKEREEVGLTCDFPKASSNEYLRWLGIEQTTTWRPLSLFVAAIGEIGYFSRSLALATLDTNEEATFATNSLAFQRYGIMAFPPCS